MIHSNPNRVSKSITNTSKSMPSIVYNELFKLHPYDAYLVGVSTDTQNVINVRKNIC